MFSGIYHPLVSNPQTSKRIGDKTMETKTIKINLEEQCLWYWWYNILSARCPNVSRSLVVDAVNKIVYKKLES